MLRRSVLVIAIVGALSAMAAAQVMPPAPKPTETQAQPSVVLPLTQPAPPEPAPLHEPAPATPDLVAPQPTPSAAVETPVAPKLVKAKKPKVLPKNLMEPVNDTPTGELINEPGKPPAIRCFVRDVMAFYDRTHIRCYNKVRGKINFFAVDTSQPIAATVVSKGLGAMQMGKPLTITFAPGSDLNPTNCDRANCRRLIDIQN